MASVRIASTVKRNASNISPTGWHDFRAFRDNDQAMEIEGTTFGTITIDGKTYEHDVIIRLSGDVVKRKKKLSKKYLRHVARAFEGRSEVRL
jgi:hypothetical protein